MHIFPDYASNIHCILLSGIHTLGTGCAHAQAMHVLTSTLTSASSMSEWSLIRASLSFGMPFRSSLPGLDLGFFFSLLLRRHVLFRLSRPSSGGSTARHKACFKTRQVVLVRRDYVVDGMFLAIQHCFSYVAVSAWTRQTKA